MREIWGDEGIYSNEYGSVLLLQCTRTNTMKLGWRQGCEGGAGDYLLCGGEDKTVRHFVGSVVSCRKSEGDRVYHGLKNNTRLTRFFNPTKKKTFDEVIASLQMAVFQCCV